MNWNIQRKFYLLEIARIGQATVTSLRKHFINHIFPSKETVYTYPYLLKDLKIERPNQVWQADITYIPMFCGFMYMFAIIDVYSRRIVGWSISNTMSMDRVEKYF